VVPATIARGLQCTVYPVGNHGRAAAGGARLLVLIYEIYIQMPMHANTTAKAAA
jgi:hypothetical protein